jgi:hypothetical protein
MTTWTPDELTAIGDADELQIASARDDGQLRAPVTIWVVRGGDDLYVRSYRGTGSSWYRGAQVRHEGHISAGGVDKDVTFAPVTDPGVNDQVDAAYRAKYGRYGGTYVDSIVTPGAREATLKLVSR